MADYKIVDSGKLDTDLTVLADAIRQRSGTSGKLEFPAGMADTVRNIPAGADLPALSNPASPEDMVIGKSLYDHTGKKVDGAVKEVSTVYNTPFQKATMEWDDDWKASNILEEDVLLRKGTAVNTWFGQYFFGDAQPSDVRKGKTFTASGGVSVEGTMEAGETNLYHYHGDVVAYPEDGAICFEHTFDKDCFYRNGEKICLNHSDLGDATTADVAKGKTFTTAAGVKIEGTMEPGSGGGSATSQITITTDITNAVEFMQYWNAIGEKGTCLYVRNGWENGFNTVDGVHWVLFTSGKVKFAIRRYSGSLSFPNFAGGSNVVAIVPAGAVFTRLELSE